MNTLTLIPVMQVRKLGHGEGEAWRSQLGNWHSLEHRLRQRDPTSGSSLTHSATCWINAATPKKGPRGQGPILLTILHHPLLQPSLGLGFFCLTPRSLSGPIHITASIGSPASLVSTEPFGFLCRLETIPHKPGPKNKEVGRLRLLTIWQRLLGDPSKPI